MEAADKKRTTEALVSSLRETRNRVWILLLKVTVSKKWNKDNDINGKRILNKVFHLI